jgi:limonene-1,2-epoxide hydrolase
MSHTPYPTAGTRSALTTPTDPRAVVEAFLDALAVPELERAAELLAEDVVYTNVGLPSIVGRDNVLRTLARLDRPSASFEVYVHAISADGPTVLTERTDVLGLRRFRAQFWVTGRFDVVDGMITLWRDSFDYFDILRSAVRGVAAMAVPGLTPAPPTGPNALPGRRSGRVRR